MEADSDSQALSRRSFLDWFLGTSLGALLVAIGYPILRFISPPAIPEAVTDRVLAGTVAELAKSHWKIFKFGNLPGILIEVEPGSLRAFSATCTHLDCTVLYREDVHRIWCACHNGFYDAQSGRNVEGPPPRPLTPYTVRIEGDDIYVLRS